MFDKNLQYKKEVFMIFFSIRSHDVNVINCYLFNSMFSTQAAPSLKTNHYSPQLPALVNNVIYSTRIAQGVNHVTSHFFVM